MCTTSAASPRRLHWQAAFTTKPYKAQTSSYDELVRLKPT